MKVEYRGKCLSFFDNILSAVTQEHIRRHLYMYVGSPLSDAEEGQAGTLARMCSSRELPYRRSSDVARPNHLY